MPLIMTRYNSLLNNHRTITFLTSFLSNQKHGGVHGARAGTSAAPHHHPPLVESAHALANHWNSQNAPGKPTQNKPANRFVCSSNSSKARLLKTFVFTSALIRLCLCFAKVLKSLKRKQIRFQLALVYYWLLTQLQTKHHSFAFNY